MTPTLTLVATIAFSFMGGVFASITALAIWSAQQARAANKLALRQDFTELIKDVLKHEQRPGGILGQSVIPELRAADVFSRVLSVSEFQIEEPNGGTPPATQERVVPPPRLAPPCSQDEVDAP